MNLNRRSMASLALGALVLIAAAIVGVILVVNRGGSSPSHSGVLGIHSSPGATPGGSQAGPTGPGTTPRSTPAPVETPAAPGVPAPPAVAGPPGNAGAGAGQAGVGAGARGTLTSGSASMPACDGTAISQQLVMQRTVFHPGEPVAITGSITNTGLSCLGAPRGFDLSIANPGSLVAASTRGGVNSGAVWAAGAKVTQTFVWNQTDCSSSPCQAAPAGNYAVAATWARFHSLTQGFSISTQCSPGDFNLQASLPSQSYRAHQPFQMVGTITNTSAHSCPLAYTIEFKVTDAAGTVFEYGLGPATTVKTWAPGQSFTEVSDAAHSDAWTPSTPGTYQVTVSSPEYGLVVGPFTIRIT